MALHIYKWTSRTIKKKKTKSLESTEDDKEDALMGLIDIKFKYNCKNNIVQEIGSQ